MDEGISLSPLLPIYPSLFLSVSLPPTSKFNPSLFLLFKGRGDLAGWEGKGRNERKIGDEERMGKKKGRQESGRKEKRRGQEKRRGGGERRPLHPGCPSPGFNHLAWIRLFFDSFTHAHKRAPITCTHTVCTHTHTHTRLRLLRHGNGTPQAPL